MTINVPKLLHMTINMSKLHNACLWWKKLNFHFLNSLFSGIAVPICKLVQRHQETQMIPSCWNIGTQSIPIVPISGNTEARTVSASLPHEMIKFSALRFAPYSSIQTPHANPHNSKEAFKRPFPLKMVCFVSDSSFSSFRQIVLGSKTTLFKLCGHHCCCWQKG